MKIFIPYTLFEIGGPISFLSNFTTSVQKKGHEVTYTFTPNFDVLFVIASCPFRYILYAKLRGIKIVQRLDGVYHGGLPGITKYIYPLRNFRMRVLHNWFADYVIYQSDFSRVACQTMLGKRTRPHSIIYNGVAFAKKNPHPHGTSEHTSLVSFASWRRRDQIEPILAAMQHLPAHCHLHLYGPYTPRVADLFETLQKYPNVTYHGKIHREELLKKLDLYDIFLFSDLAACPNSILEAMAAGLPVVAYDRGAAGELVTVGKAGEVVPLPNHNPFSVEYPFTGESYRSFARAIESVAEQLPMYSRAAYDRAITHFSLTDMTTKYLTILTSK